MGFALTSIELDHKIQIWEDTGMIQKKKKKRGHTKSLQRSSFVLHCDVVTDH